MTEYRAGRPAANGECTSRKLAMMRRPSPALLRGSVTLSLLAGLVLLPGEASAETVRVSSLSALQNALNSAKPGDRIELADGSYTATGAIQVNRSGTSAAPVTVAAANTGRAEIRGSTGFSFAGGVNNVGLQGLTRRHGGSMSIPADAHHIRLTRNTVQLSGDGNWVTVNGDDVEVDHNSFQNRSTAGVFLQVSGPSDDVAKRTRIHHNYFYNHTFSGANGGESIRF